MSDTFDPQPVVKPGAPASTEAFDPQPISKPPRVNLEGPKEAIPNTPPRIVTSDFDPQPLGANDTSISERFLGHTERSFNSSLVGEAKANYESGLALSKNADQIEAQLKAAKEKDQQTVYLSPSSNGRMLGTAQAMPVDEGYRQLAIMRAEADNLKAEYSLSSQLAKDRYDQIQPWAKDSHPLLSGMTALAGEVVGGLGSPENWLGTAPERLAAGFLKDIGKSALRGALEMAPVGAAQSAFRQYSETARGEREGGVNLGELSEDALFAAGFGAGIGGASRGLGRLLGDFKETGASGSFGSRLDLGDTSTWEKPDFSTQGSPGRAKQGGERVEPRLFPEEPTLPAGEPEVRAAEPKPGRPDVSPEEFADKLPDKQKELLLRAPEQYGEMHAEDPERFPLPEDAYKAKDSGEEEGASRREDGGELSSRPTLPDDARLTVFDHAETGRPSDPAEPLAARAPADAKGTSASGTQAVPYQADYKAPFKPKLWKDWLLNTFNPTSRHVEGTITVSQGKGKPRLDTGINPTRATETAIISRNAALALDWSRIHQAFRTKITLTAPSGKTFRTTLAGLSASAPEADQLAVIRALDDIKNGNKNHPIPNGPMREVFNVLRGMTDTARDLLKSIGKLQDAEHANSFRIWQSSVDPNFKQSMREGTLRGGGGFLKERTRETIDDGFAAGDKLITTDPIELNKIRLFSMMQYYHGEMLRREMVGTKIARFYRGYARPDAGSGLVRLDDPAFDSYRYIEELNHLVTHETSVDPQVERALKKVTDLLGVIQRTPLRGEDDYLAGRVAGKESGKNASGYTYSTPGAPVTAVFGSAQQVMEHEIGHQIDRLHPELRQSMVSNLVALRELQQLSLLRQETAMKAGLVPQSYIRGYLTTEPEMMANLFHAYWYAPQVLEKTAPTVLKVLENWLDRKGALGEAIRKVEPSLEIASRTRTETVKGEPGHTKYEGSYYAPEPIAMLFNNFMSQGLSRFDLVRGMKNINNAVNRIHFSASLFHFFVISNDAVISNTARGLEQLSRGEFSEGLKTSAASLPILNFLNIRDTYKRGAEARRSVAQEMLGESTSPISRLVIESGMRIEQMYWNKALNSENFMQIIKGGKFRTELLKDVSAKTSGWGKAGQVVKNAAELAYKAIELVPEAIMSEYVPSMKIGIMLNMADDIMRREPGMSLPVLRDRLERLSSSLDNRMGQIVYDNLFWHKGIKDVGFLATQSLGWTLGTVREIGGGAVDTPTYLNNLIRSGGKETALTHRMAYTLALPITMGLYGMMTQLVLTTAFTGRPSPPTSWRDYFFPRTGRMLPRGVPERISLPSYIKDVFQWFHAPVQTIAGKESALVQNAQQLWNWTDYRGIPITDPMHSAPQQMWEFLGYATAQVMPFSFVAGQSKEQKELNKDSTQNIYSKFLSIMGMNPAPSWLVDSAADQSARSKRNVREHRAFMRAHEPQSTTPQIPNITVRP